MPQPRSDQRLGVLLVVGPHPKAAGHDDHRRWAVDPRRYEQLRIDVDRLTPGGVVDGLVVVGGVGAGNGQQLALHAGIGDRAVSEAVGLHGDGT